MTLVSSKGVGSQPEHRITSKKNIWPLGNLCQVHEDLKVQKQKYKLRSCGMDSGPDADKWH